MTPPLNQLMRILLFQLRILELTQLSHISPFDEFSVPNLTRWLKQIEQQKMIQTTRTISVVPKLEQPLISWTPEKPTPPTSVVCNQLRLRWQTWRPKSCFIFWASPTAVHFYGGVAGGRRQPLQLSHDLGTSAIFVHWTQKQPGLLSDWYGEDYLRQHPFPFPFMPDAALLGPAGVPETLIEFGGQYPLRKLQRWHQACAASQLSYELW